MRFNNIIRRVWWVFAIDATIGVLNEFVFSHEAAKLNAAGTAFLIFISLIAVTIAAFFEARHSGRILDAIKMGAMFLFIWKPILFVVFSALSLATGSVDYTNAPLAALGSVFALLLFSPIVLILCGCAGWLGSKLKRGE